MKGPLKLSLAIALALSGADVWALGLGAIQIKSGLNQPLDAEIPVIAESPAEMAGLRVDMASAEDFQRVGLSRARVSVPIEFSIGTNSRGQTVIKATTKDVVREPFVDFLLEVNWAKGKLLREYTVLLDPPVSAPAKTAMVAAAPESAPAKTQPLSVPTKSAPPPKPPKVSAPVEQPKVAVQPKPVLAPKPAPSNPAPVEHHAAASGEYGPVAEGETLSQIAASVRDDNTNANRMMLALLKANPNAFFKDNINALKRGAILRIPSSDELKATGSMTDVVAAVRSQNEAWAGNVPTAAPTMVAHAGAKDDASTPAKIDKTAVATPPAKTERLALVPPRAGSGSQSTSEHAGASGGSSKDAADSKAELQRTKEALTSRDQEVAEMKSRVKQLEDIGNKDQRLISLKDSEIADLQTKLKALQGGKTPTTTATTTATLPPMTATPPASTTTKPADTSTTAKTDAKVTSDDIWGDGTNKSTAAKNGMPATAMTATPPASTTSTPSSSTAPSTTTSMTPSSSTASTPTSTSTSTPTAVSDTSPKDSTTTTSTPPTEPSTSSSTPSTSTTPAPTAVVATATPVKSPTPAKISPIVPPEQPWYQNQTLLMGGGAVLLLVGLFALISFMRKPKTVLIPAGDGDPVALDADQLAVASEEEHRLLDELAADPGNTAVSLELLRLYYAHGEAAKFEATAEAMHANVVDLSGSEWQEAMAMGAVIVPHNPLFAGGDTGMMHDHLHGTDDDATLFGTHHDEHVGELRDDFERLTKPSDAVPDDNFDFDLPEQHAAPLIAETHDDLSFDLPPPTSAPVVAKPVIVEPVAVKADEFFVGEDAIGTKLDLAKAYLDMGDPEGARSMLDEVLSEGNDVQKGEARKLLADIK